MLAVTGSVQADTSTREGSTTTQQTQLTGTVGSGASQGAYTVDIERKLSQTPMTETLFDSSKQYTITITEV